jgi:hypothetical protein
VGHLRDTRNVPPNRPVFALILFSSATIVTTLERPLLVVSGLHKTDRMYLRTPNLGFTPSPFLFFVVFSSPQIQPEPNGVRRQSVIQSRASWSYRAAVSLSRQAICRFVRRSVMPNLKPSPVLVLYPITTALRCRRLIAHSASGNGSAGLAAGAQSRPSAPEVSHQRCTFSRKFAPFVGRHWLNFAPLSSTDMQEGLIKNSKKTSVKVASGAGVLRPSPGYIMAQQEGGCDTRQ